MRIVKVAAAVLNQTPLDWEGNARRIRAVLAEAREQGAQVICLPELCLTGYGCEDAFLAPWVARAARELLRELAPETRGQVVSFGLPLWYRKSLYNTACLVADGRVHGFVAKQALAAQGIHYEPRWFTPWPEGEVGAVEWEGRSVPLGDLVFHVDGVRIGFEICEDAWGAERPGSALSARGVDVLLNPSASHFAFGKHEVRRRLVLEGSRAFGVAYIYTNLLGNEAGRAIYDGGALIASLGELRAAGPRFDFTEHHLTCATVDVDATCTSRPSHARPEREEEPAGRVEVACRLEEREPEADPPPPPAWEQSAHLKEEEFTRAVALGLHDYRRKSGSEGFVVSLSGGADSAAVAVLVSCAARLAALGDAARSDGAALVRPQLCTVYQATRNSSEATRAAARALAEGLGAEHHELDVDGLVQTYRALGEGALGRPLTWEADDLALQNIQARVRAPSVWLLANVRRALLLTTSNRSEAAVGYATMDGDTCGGLSPIAGIDKAFLRGWLRFMEERGPAGLGPVPALAAVNALSPTAELRPAEEHQTDEADLMPYPVLDAIERLAVRDRLAPLEAFRRLRASRPDVAPAELGAWVERFYRLFARNQWKRERYAPSFHLDDENLDPKTWCRWPILSGGFARELRALREHLAALERGTPPER